MKKITICYSDDISESVVKGMINKSLKTFPIAVEAEDFLMIFDNTEESEILQLKQKAISSSKTILTCENKL